MLKLISSDEVSIISLVVFALMLVACAWLFWFFLKALKTKSGKVPTMGDKEWDGIKENDGSTPYGMHIMMGLVILFAIWYVAFGYPINHSHSQEWYAAESQKAQTDLDKKYADADMHTLSNIGESVFNSNCVICHGVDGQGMGGVAANLFQFGTEEHIAYVIKVGSKGLGKITPIMPSQWELMGPDDAARQAKAYDVAAYVLSFSHHKSVKGDPAKGKETYDQVCTTCHSPDGTGRGPDGKTDNFAANLADYGTVGYTMNTIERGKAGILGTMPSFKEAGNLSQIQLKAVAVYVTTGLKQH